MGEKNFFFDINFFRIRKLGKWAKNTIKSFFVGLHAEMSVLPPFSGSAAHNFQKCAQLLILTSQKHETCVKSCRTP